MLQMGNTMKEILIYGKHIWLYIFVYINKYKVLFNQSTFSSFVGILMSAVNGDNVNKGKQY